MNLFSNLSIQSKNPFNIIYLLALIAIILASSIGLLWIFDQRPPYPNEELFILINIYFWTIFITSIAIKQKSYLLAHQFIGFKNTQIKYVGIAIAGSLLLWVFDLLLQKHFFQTDIYKEALTWGDKNQLVPNWGLFITICIMTPIIEEILFRGLFMKSLESYLSLFLNVILLSFLFAYIHSSLTNFLTLFIAALFYSWLTIKSKSIYPSIMAHIFNNSMTFFLYKLIL